MQVALRPRTTRLGTAAMMAAGLLLQARAGAAQPCDEHGCTVTNTVQVHVGTVLRLAVQGATEVLATASAMTLRSGRLAGVGPTATVRSNGAWRLQVSAANEVWTPVDAGARTDKPASDLGWSTRADQGFVTVGIDPTDVARGGPTNGVELPMFYRARFASTNDTPGTYSLTVRLTLVGA